MLTIICWFKPFRVGCSWIPSSYFSCQCWQNSLVHLGQDVPVGPHRCSSDMLVKKSLRQGTVTKTTGRLSKQGRAFPLMKKCHSLCDLAFSEILTKSHSGHTSTSLQHKSDYLRDAYINALKVIKCSSSRGTSMLKQSNYFLYNGIICCRPEHQITHLTLAIEL